MNIFDERLKCPPPQCCMGCANLDRSGQEAEARYRCREDRPMHDPCGYRKIKPLGPDAAPWEARTT